METQAPSEKCPLCGTSTSRVLGVKQTTRDFSILRCKTCDLVFAAPRPSPEELADFYSSNYFSGSEKRYEDYQSCAELWNRHMWPTLAKWYPVTEAPNRRLLDVGAATGGFVSEAGKDGWEAEGIELSSDAAAIANAAGLNVYAGDLWSVPLRGDYGLITMWHVVEHLLDPVQAVKRAAELLAPKGLLLIELPNWHSAGRIAKGLQWANLTPPEHINFFYPATLRRLMSTIGLRTLKLETLAHRFPQSPFPKREILNAIGWTSGKLGLGGNARILARRD